MPRLSRCYWGWCLVHEVFSVSVLVLLSSLWAFSCTKLKKSSFDRKSSVTPKLWSHHHGMAACHPRLLLPLGWSPANWYVGFVSTSALVVSWGQEHVNNWVHRSQKHSAEAAELLRCRLSILFWRWDPRSGCHTLLCSLPKVMLALVILCGRQLLCLTYVDVESVVPR